MQVSQLRVREDFLILNLLIDFLILIAFLTYLKLRNQLETETLKNLTMINLNYLKNVKSERAVNNWHFETYCVMHVNGPKVNV